jgi:acyl carrier protein
MPEKFIVAVAEALDKNVASMTLTDRFKEYEEWDSLAVLAVMAGLEESYNVVLSRHDLDRLGHHPWHTSPSRVFE